MNSSSSKLYCVYLASPYLSIVEISWSWILRYSILIKKRKENSSSYFDDDHETWQILRRRVMDVEEYVPNHLMQSLWF